ncbi:unnamed protein product [Coregonus sp. 'balchen']|nr:unnamed protein product [Coregonus sp. 'balchen']
MLTSRVIQGRGRPWEWGGTRWGAAGREEGGGVGGGVSWGGGGVSGGGVCGAEEMEIKKMAKTGNKEACTILAKQLVQLRRQKKQDLRLNDTLDEIFDESGDEEESDSIVNQVLDEIGIEISGKMVSAPSTSRNNPSASTSKSDSISDADIERQLKALGVD